MTNLPQPKCGIDSFGLERNARREVRTRAQAKHFIGKFSKQDGEKAQKARAYWVREAALHNFQ